MAADEELHLASAATPKPWTNRLGLGIIAIAFALGAGVGVALVATQIAPAKTDLTSAHTKAFCASYCRRNHSCLESTTTDSDIWGPNYLYREYTEKEWASAHKACPAYFKKQDPC